MSDPIPTTQGSPTIGTKSDAASAPVANPVKPSEITLSTIWQGLTVGQFWGLCGALLGLVIGTFLFGMWMEKQRRNRQPLDGRGQVVKPAVGIAESGRRWNDGPGPGVPSMKLPPCLPW